MAPGYEIALWLAGAGLAGLAVGLWRLRVEEAARVRALRSVLRTGPDPRRVPDIRFRADRTIRMVPHRAPSAAAPSRRGRPGAAAPSAAARAFLREA